MTPELAELIDDPEIAALVLRAVTRHLVERVRVDGVVATGRCRQLIEQLYDVAHPGELSASGHGDEAPGMIGVVITDATGMVTAAQLAQDTGYTPRTCRRWAATGRVRAVRAGTTWLIDPQSLTKGAA